MAKETLNQAREETRGEVSEREVKRSIIGYTLPSVEFYALLKPTPDGGSQSSQVLEKSSWVPYLAEAARISADNQYELGRQVGFYPEGIVINGAYTYSFQPEKTKAEAIARGAKISARDYRPRIIPQISPHAERFWRNSREIRLSADGAFRDDGAGEYLGRLMFRNIANREPEAQTALQIVYGEPNLNVSSSADLHALAPYGGNNLPMETQAFSFMVTLPTERGKKSGRDGGFPLVVSLDGCPLEVRRRHVASQLLFASIANPQVVTPILVSKDPTLGISANNRLERFNQELDRRLKDWWILKDLMEQRQQADWLADESDIRTQTFLGAHRRELFLPGELSLTDWIDIPFGTTKEEVREKKESFWEVAVSKLETATGIVGSMIDQLPSIEYQLVIANYLSFFPMSNWDEARDMLAEYEMATGRKFKKFFRIPMLRRTETESISTPSDDIQAEVPEPIAFEETKTEPES